MHARTPTRHARSKSCTFQYMAVIWWWRINISYIEWLNEWMNHFMTHIYIYWYCVDKSIAMKEWTKRGKKTFLPHHLGQQQQLVKHMILSINRHEVNSTNENRWEWTKYSVSDARSLLLFKFEVNKTIWDEGTEYRGVGKQLINRIYSDLRQTSE